MKLCLVLIVASLCVACAAGSPFSKIREFLSDLDQEIECHDGVCSSAVNRLSKRNAESDLEQRIDDGIVRVKRGGPGSVRVGENGAGTPPPPATRRPRGGNKRGKRSPRRINRGERRREQRERNRERQEDRREEREQNREHRQEEEREREKHREEEENLEREHRREEEEKRRRDQRRHQRRRG